MATLPRMKNGSDKLGLPRLEEFETPPVTMHEVFSAPATPNMLEFESSDLSAFRRGEKVRMTEPIPTKRKFSIPSPFSRNKRPSKKKIMQDEIEGLKAQLKKQKQINQRIVKTVNNTMTKISGKYVMLNCTNTIQNVEEIEPILQKLQTLIEALNASVDEQAKSRAEMDSKQKNTELHLQEMKDMMLSCERKLITLSVKGSSAAKSLSELKSMLKEVQSDHSDEAVLGTAVSVIESFIQKHKFLNEDKLLKQFLRESTTAVETGVKRIMRKFGFQTWEEFARFLGLNARSSNYGTRKDDDDNEEGVKLLLKWVNKADRHNGGKLVELVKSYEEKQRERMADSYQEQVKHKFADLQNERANTSNVLYERQPSQPPLKMDGVKEVEPDSNSQFQHILEIGQMLVDVKKTVSNNEKILKKFFPQELDSEDE